MALMIATSPYGLFWREDEVLWFPGAGAKNGFRILGRRGSHKPVVQVADFRHQRGIYILYGDYGPHYVGLARKRPLGDRLKDHLSNKLEGKWDRFSWFGFKSVMKKKNDDGLQQLREEVPEHAKIAPHKLIGDIEALLIKAMGLSNIKNMNITGAKQWIQIKRLEEVDFCERVKS